MKALDLNKGPLLEFNFYLDQSFKEFVESTMKQELGLIQKGVPEKNIRIDIGFAADKI